MKVYLRPIKKPFAFFLSVFAVAGAFLFNLPLVRADFNDVIYTDKSYLAINTLTEQGIVGGLTEDTFAPDQILPRVQALMLVLRYGGYKVSEEGIQSSFFSDVDEDIWYAAAVQQGVNLGIVKGNNDGTFAPSRAVTGPEFLMMIARTDAANLSAFEEEGGQWYTAIMNYAQANGTYSNSDPTVVLTRKDAANILYLSLLLKRADDNDFLSSQAQKHMSHIESSVAANQLATATYHAKLALNLMLEIKENLPNNNSVAANKNIAEGYLAWVNSVLAALQNDNDSAVAGVSQALEAATEAYFIDAATQPLGSHLKDIACEVYSQLSEPKGEVPKDCVGRVVS